MRSAFPTRLPFSEACAILDRVASASLMPAQAQPLTRCLGHVLAADLIADVNLPGFDNSAMDGFAARGADLQAGGNILLTVIDEQFAGASRDLAIESGQCVRITTGAPMPAGADTVVIKENVELRGDQLTVPGPVRIGAHRRSAGEDVRASDRVLAAGQLLTPAALSLAAAVGRHELSVHRRPTVAIFTTGDELKPPGSSLAPGEIFDSNRVLLQTLLASDGFEPVAWPVLPDDPDRILAALRDAASSFDVVLTCGGVSAGEKDYLPELLAEHGSVHFWKVMMRPGMPFLAGRLGSAHMLCLPGNPVSVFATYLTLARRLLDGIQGRAEPRPRVYARLSAAIAKTHERLEFLRGVLHCDQTGQMLVAMNPADGSHRLRAVAESNALIVVPEGAGQWPAGAVLEVLPLSGA